MVCVLAVVAVEVEREAPILGEGAQEFREQLHVESPYLFRHRAEVAREVAPGPQVDDGRRERLDEGHARVGEARDAAPLAERLVEGASEHEPCVLDRVVVIHPRIALGLNCEVHAGMVGEQVQEMVQKSHPCRDLGLPPAVELQAHPDERLRRFSFSTTFTRHLPPGSLDPSILTDNLYPTRVVTLAAWFSKPSRRARRSTCAPRSRRASLVK